MNGTAWLRAIVIHLPDMAGMQILSREVLFVYGVAENNIYVYGFAFQGKKVLICGGAEKEIDWMSILADA